MAAGEVRGDGVVQPEIVEEDATSPRLGGGCGRLGLPAAIAQAAVAHVLGVVPQGVQVVIVGADGPAPLVVLRPLVEMALPVCHREPRRVRRLLVALVAQPQRLRKVGARDHGHVIRPEPAPAHPIRDGLRAVIHSVALECLVPGVVVGEGVAERPGLLLAVGLRPVRERCELGLNIPVERHVGRPSEVVDQAHAPFVQGAPQVGIVAEEHVTVPAGEATRVPVDGAIPDDVARATIHVVLNEHAPARLHEPIGDRLVRPPIGPSGPAVLDAQPARA
mmetsp:Transcript_126747/g.366886  ORF Transcript_126747/g.366886 Transcript_126747/m.366886 type:complete len:277 (-) Transcript_126747:285-1115(-)